MQVHASGTWQPRPVHVYYLWEQQVCKHTLTLHTHTHTHNRVYVCHRRSPAIVRVGDENVNLSLYSSKVCFEISLAIPPPETEHISPVYVLSWRSGVVCAVNVVTRGDTVLIAVLFI